MNCVPSRRTLYILELACIEEETNGILFCLNVREFESQNWRLINNDDIVRLIIFYLFYNRLCSLHFKKFLLGPSFSALN